MHGRHIRSTSALIGLLLCCLSWAAAQADALTPAWTRDFGYAINWQHMTAAGQLIVSTPEALYSIDPTNGAPLWSRPGFGGMAQAHFEELPGTPLAMISDGRDDAHLQVLNIYTGALVFDSQTENLTQILSTHVLAHSGSLLIAGFEVGKARPTLFLYGIEDGKRLWSSDVLNSGMGGFASLLLTAALVMTDASPVQSAPLELDDGTFLLGAMGNLYRFDHASGEVIWQTTFTGGLYELVLSDRHPDIVLVGAAEMDTTISSDGTEHPSASTSYQAFRLSDGKKVFKRPVRFNQLMSELIRPVDSGFVVSEADSGKGRLHLLDSATGERPWGKRGRGIGINGRVVDYTSVGNDLIVTAGYDSIWTNKDTEYQLYVLDPVGGTLRFEDPVTIRGRLLETELTARGLVYVTTHEINVFDPSSGSLLSTPALYSKESLVTVNDGRSIFAFDSDAGLLYRFDRDSGSVARVSTSPFEFPNRDGAQSLDLVGDRIVLLGQQTVAGFSRDGALLFNVHYRAPRDPAWLRSLAWAEGIRAGMASAYAGVYSAAFASAAANEAEGSVGAEIATGLEQGFGDLQQGYAGLAGDYVGFARRRYEASAEARDFMFMMVQDEDRRVFLASVSKHDGSVVSHIEMGRDKEPDYQVDDIGGSVFYRPSESTLRAYRFAAR